MKIGDFALNKKLLKEAEETFKNLKEDQVEEVLLVTKGAAFLASMMIELVESDALINIDMPQEKLSNLIMKMLAQGTALGILNLSSRSSDSKLFINIFKHYFEQVIEQFVELKNDKN